MIICNKDLRLGPPSQKILIGVIFAILLILSCNLSTRNSIVNNHLSTVQYSILKIKINDNVDEVEDDFKDKISALIYKHSKSSYIPDNSQQNDEF